MPLAPGTEKALENGKSPRAPLPPGRATCEGESLLLTHVRTTYEQGLGEP